MRSAGSFQRRFIPAAGVPDERPDGTGNSSDDLSVL
jgi:hypothetical protein